MVSVFYFKDMLIACEYISSKQIEIELELFFEWCMDHLDDMKLFQVELLSRWIIEH